MLKFFRIIRQKLVIKGNFKKYLIYAIGEILLVMIGILLALEVNNWNEERIREAVELEFLEGFKYDLEIDFEYIEKVLPTITTFKSSTNIILVSLEKDVPWHDSLKYHFGNIDNYWPAVFSSSTYESITSRDWSIISNKNLREDLINYYRKLGLVVEHQKKYRDELLEISRDVWSSRLQSFWESNYETWKIENTIDSFSREELGGYALPLNFDQLKSDSEYRYSLIRLREISNWFRESLLVNLQNGAEELLNDIERELQEKKTGE